MRTKLDQEMKNLIISYYLSGKQQREIAEILNCAQTSVSNVLLKSGIKTRVGKNIIYIDVNTSFFKKINSEESAYFLGLLYADGNVSKNIACVSLKLKSNDQSIIEKFRDIMSPSSPVKIRSCD